MLLPLPDEICPRINQSMTDVNDINFPNWDTKGMLSHRNLFHPVLVHDKNCIAHDAIGNMQRVAIYF